MKNNFCAVLINTHPILILNIFFFISNSTLEDAAVAVSSYINYCISITIEEKEIKIYPNSKPWISKDIRNLLKHKHMAIKQNDRGEKKRIQRKIDKLVKHDKRRFGERIKNKFRSGNPKCAWDGLKKILGNNRKCNVEMPSDVEPMTFVNDLNVFFNRFDVTDFSVELQDVKSLLINDINENDIDRIEVCKSDVERLFKCTKPNKASGPDLISGKILKMFYIELAPIFTHLFEWSLNSYTVPRIWKSANISPIGKISKPKCFNDYRPIALTSVTMKCFEKLIKNMLIEKTQIFADPYQFAYCDKKGVDDALISFLHPIYDHLDKAKSYVRTLFLDFSSAFNTIQPHVLVDKLRNFNVHPYLCLWISDFISMRSQRVTIRNYVSNYISSNTGTPQGCVLSPLLFSIYICNLRCINTSCKIVKFADDMCITGLIINNDESAYRNEVNHVINWCSDNFLVINAKKTKEMIFDFRRNNTDMDELIVNNERVTRTSEHKYLGIIINDKLNWNKHTQGVYSKSTQRLHFLRKLNKFNVGQEALSLFYQSVIKSVICFCCIAWFSNLTKKNTNQIKKITRVAGKIIGMELPCISSFCDKSALTKLDIILKDESHPLFGYITFNKSGRIRQTTVKTNRLKNSFIPHTCQLYNSQFSR